MPEVDAGHEDGAESGREVDPRLESGPAAPGRIDVIATTISGSISDWGKVKQIAPLFAVHGFCDVELHVAESHARAREIARTVLAGAAATTGGDERPGGGAAPGTGGGSAGGHVLISAGGSGTFNAVLEGCCDSGVPLDSIRLGFLRKGSADLIGKVLGMPDEIEAAIAVFAASIRDDVTMPCDVLRVEEGGGSVAPRHFVGYGGAEIFGRIPHFTENRAMKWYKGLLSQLLGDLGPFTTGMSLALLEKLLAPPWRRGRRWRIILDGEPVAEDRYQALIIVNGYLGRELPYARDPLGSGRFHLFALRDLGAWRLPAQAHRARDGSIMREPERWGMTSYTAHLSLRIEPTDGGVFPLNVDGSTMLCTGSAALSIVNRIQLIARKGGGASPGIPSTR